MCCTIGSIGDAFTHQQLFDLTPALERGECVDVLQKKVLALHRARLRQYFQCFRRPANLVQPRNQRGESFIGKFGGSLVKLCQARRVSESLHSIRNILIGRGLDPAAHEFQVPAACDKGGHQDDFQARLLLPSGSSCVRPQLVPEWRLE